MTEVEQEFGIELPLDDFDVDGFRSVEQIAALGGRAPGGMIRPAERDDLPAVAAAVRRLGRLGP